MSRLDIPFPRRIFDDAGKPIFPPHRGFIAGLWHQFRLKRLGRSDFSAKGKAEGSENEEGVTKHFDKYEVPVGTRILGDEPFFTKQLCSFEM